MSNTYSGRLTQPPAGQRDELASFHSDHLIGAKEISKDLGGRVSWCLNMRRWPDMKMELKYESYVDLSTQHIAALRDLINVLMKSVGERGEFRIELGGSLYYGTYMVTDETVEVRVTPLKKRLRKSRGTAKTQTSSRWSSATMLLPENCE